MNRLVALIFTVVLMLAGITAQAQDDKWRVDLRVYGLGAGMEGKIGALGRTAEVNLSFSDILSNLEFGFFGGVSAYKGPWSINGDVAYSGLGMENNQAKADVNQWVIGTDVGYEFHPHVAFLAGVRVNALRDTFTFKGPLGFEAEPHKSWADPVVGLRFTPPLGQNWRLYTRFDIGGFGVASKFTYQVHALVLRSLSKRTSLDFGYRVLGINYDKGTGIDRFLYDVTVSGPEAGMTLSF